MEKITDGSQHNLECTQCSRRKPENERQPGHFASAATHRWGGATRVRRKRAGGLGHCSCTGDQRRHWQRSQSRGGPATLHCCCSGSRGSHDDGSGTHDRDASVRAHAAVLWCEWRRAVACRCVAFCTTLCGPTSFSGRTAPGIGIGRVVVLLAAQTQSLASRIAADDLLIGVLAILVQFHSGLDPVAQSFHSPRHPAARYSSLDVHAQRSVRTAGDCSIGVDSVAQQTTWPDVRVELCSRPPLLLFAHHTTAVLRATPGISDRSTERWSVRSCDEHIATQ